MYGYDVFARLKAGSAGGKAGLASVSPVIWALGITSCLTDISAEMVNSLLPVYLVLHLHMSPLQFGAIDGVYNGLSVALVSVMAGVLADRWRRQKEVAAAGYSFSALCKLLLAAAGGAWGWIALIAGFDRIGKGIRTAPRDALISLHASPGMLGAAFGVHRALDSAGALLGPVVAFALLAQVPGRFDVAWIVSFVIALLGVAALWLLVPASRAHDSADGFEPSRDWRALRSPALLKCALCGTALALLTVSDGFIYLLLQQRTGISSSVLPLLYVGTAGVFMLTAIPVGRIADGYGRGRTFLGGYLVLGLVYLLLMVPADLPPAVRLTSVGLLGLYYAATEGVLMAMASAAVPSARRATSLAIVATCVGLGKLVSSLAFGWLWQTYGARNALIVFAFGLVVVLVVVWPLLGSQHGKRESP